MALASYPAPPSAQKRSGTEGVCHLSHCQSSFWPLSPSPQRPSSLAHFPSALNLFGRVCQELLEDTVHVRTNKRGMRHSACRRIFTAVAITLPLVGTGTLTLLALVRISGVRRTSQAARAAKTSNTTPASTADDTITDTVLDTEYAVASATIATELTLRDDSNPAGLGNSISQQKRPSIALSTPPKASPRLEHVADMAIESAITAAHEAGRIPCGNGPLTPPSALPQRTARHSHGSPCMPKDVMHVSDSMRCVVTVVDNCSRTKV